MEYIGERIWAGNLGNIFVILSFVAALLATYSYFQATKESNENSAWKKIGRWSFFIHSFAVIGVISTLFFMLLNQYFEYYYIWQHSNSEMPLKYVFSAFWEGQEGSFLLWSFWHVILGLILIKTTKSFENHVMTTFSLVQVFISSMVLGIYIFDYKIGSNPFATLLREHPDFANIPLFKNPNYIDGLDGRGLNPLLQNYWMTIHPPTLFLGFASTLVPFCFAIAALWKKDYQSWLKHAIPWSIFGVMILGTGILMGGAWAYEALSFGGFWAWDPVENASLVPWITFVGALHLMIIQKNKSKGVISTFVFTLITFIFILYSTFLTRSGVLGETSVHAFTDLGMTGQLLIYLLFFVFLSTFLILKNYKKFPREETEDALWSREFWIFVGSLVLFLGAFQIIFETSKPIINNLFGTNLALSISSSDRIAVYHAWQIPIATILLIIIGIAQFLKYKDTPTKEIIKNLTVPFISALILTTLFAFIISQYQPYYLILMFSGWFAITSNASYFIAVLKGKISKAGSSIAHIGFALIIIGALISTSKSDIISTNSTGIDITQLGNEFKNQENILMFKNDTLLMGNYKVMYTGKKKDGINILYEINYFDSKTNKFLFSLYPRVQLNPRMGNVAEPDTRHFLTKDIYTHVTYARLEEEKHDHEHEDDYEEPKTFKVSIGDSLFSSNAIMILNGISKEDDISTMNLNKGDIAVIANITIKDMANNSYTATPLYIIKDTSYVYQIPFEIEALGIKLNFKSIIPAENKVEIEVFEKHSNSREFIIMKAIIFPYINILWIGCILMALGTLIAIVNRIKTTKW
jgi:cytochrome c-type biogenesis protein CcmF